MTSDSERAMKSRKQRVKQGFKTLGVTISPEAHEALKALMDANGWKQREAIERALISTAAQLETSDGEQETSFKPTEASLETNDSVREAMDIAEKAMKISQNLFMAYDALRQRVDFLEKHLPRQPSGKERHVAMVQAKRTTLQSKIAQAVSREGWENINWENLHAAIVASGEVSVYNDFRQFIRFAERHKAQIEKMAAEFKQLASANEVQINMASDEKV